MEKFKQYISEIIFGIAILILLLVSADYIMRPKIKIKFGAGIQVVSIDEVFQSLLSNQL